MNDIFKNIIPVIMINLKLVYEFQCKLYKDKLFDQFHTMLEEQAVYSSGNEKAFYFDLFSIHFMGSKCNRNVIIN